MSELLLNDPRFLTSAMAEILLSQNLVDEAAAVIDHLEKKGIDDATAKDLRDRLKEIRKQSEAREVAPTGKDRVTLEIADGVLFIEWEATPEGLEMAKRKARYSGKTIARIFRAVPGPRGVRTSYQDIEANLDAARLNLTGLPRSSVCVAAIGFLSNTGEFVPLASTEPLAVSL